jgi:large subunit ribosomal protein L35
MDLSIGDLDLEYGQSYNSADVQGDPVIDINLVDGPYYTILCVDVAPQKNYPIFESWLHWARVNVRLTVDTGVDTATYQPPNPPKYSGYHNYYFRILRQGREFNNNVVEEITNLTATRKNFDYRAFKKEYNLVSVSKYKFKAIKN